MKKWTSKNNGLGISILFVMLVTTAICQGRVITVDDNAPADFNNIQAAINAFKEGDSIIVADGNYTGKGNRDIINSADPCIKNLIIRSANGPENCIINCASTSSKVYRGFNFYGVNKNENFVIDGFTVINGVKDGGGGAVYFDVNTANLEIVNCIFKNNRATNGGAIYVRNGNLKVKNCSFIGNTAGSLIYKGDGGGICCENNFNSQNIIIEDCIFNGNTASEGGGAISNYKVDKPVYKNCSFINNKASYGGGIGDYSNNPTFENCTFNGNKAETGGGICAGAKDKAVYKNCTFNGNEATYDYGGGICNYNNNNTIYSNCTFNNNIALTGGGIYDKSYDTSNEPVFENCIFKGNQSQVGGGAFVVGKSIFKNCEFYENSMFGLYGWGTLINCVFTKNVGSGAYFSGDFINCIFKENSANRGDGGGVYSQQLSTNDRFKNCVFIKNYAKGRGGGVYAISSQISIMFENCLFLENSAGSGGGILSSGSTSSFVIKNCTFVGNSALGYGGGVYGNSIRSPIMISNSILWNNTDKDGIGKYSQIYDFFWNSRYPRFAGVGYSCVQGWTSEWGGIGNMGIDPLFVDPCNSDPNLRNYHLQAGSPCINSGDPNYVAEVNETDLDGQPRVMYGRIDMGAYEFLDQIPKANAGPDQIVYAYIDGIADVNLDGSDSNDSDGQPLTYKWTWTIDSNVYEANEVNPIIKLPVGVHTIELVVNDGFEDSLPDYVDVNVVGPVKAGVEVLPQTINVRSHGRWIWVYMVLPKGCNAKDVDKSQPLVMEPLGVESKMMNVFTGFRRYVWITAAFDRDEVCDNITTGRQKISVVGQFKTGQYFYGSDVIKVIGKKK